MTTNEQKEHEQARTARVIDGDCVLRKDFEPRQSLFHALGSIRVYHGCAPLVLLERRSVYRSNSVVV
jgi:hypothetical protein